MRIVNPAEDAERDVAREEGRQEGVVGNRIQNARSLLDLLSDEVIADRIGLAEEEVRKLRKDSYQ